MNLETIVTNLTETFNKLKEEESKEFYNYEKNKLYSYLNGLSDSLKKHKAFIAGGTITSLFTGNEINDIDIYFRNEESMLAFLKEHWKNGQTYVTCLTNKSVLMVKGKEPDFLKLQLIHFKYFKDANDIFNTFDFTVCMGAYDFSDEQFYLHKEFMKHNSQRILKFNKNTAFPLVSLLRVQKYANKKYSISKSEMIRIMLSCMVLDIKTIDDLKNHLGGMYGVNYDKLVKLEEGEEFSIDLIIDKLTDISKSDDYFKKPEEVKFDDLDDIIDHINKTPYSIVVLDNKDYRICFDGTLKRLSKKPSEYKTLEVDEYFNKTKFYKWVKKVDEGKYVSHYDNKFYYINGETSTAKGSSADSVIWLVEKSNISKGTYAWQDTLIEVSLTPQEFITKNTSEAIKAKSCKVIREVLKEEYSDWDC